MIPVTETINLSEDEIEEHFIRSPGPGGQKVNKTESAVQLRFGARLCPALSNAVFFAIEGVGRQADDAGWRHCNYSRPPGSSRKRSVISAVMN